MHIKRDHRQFGCQNTSFKNKFETKLVIRMHSLQSCAHSHPSLVTRHMSTYIVWYFGPNVCIDLDKCADWLTVAANSVSLSLTQCETTARRTAHSFKINFISILLSRCGNCTHSQLAHLCSTHTQQVSYFTMLSSSFGVTRRRAVATNSTHTHTHAFRELPSSVMEFRKGGKIVVHINTIRRRIVDIIRHKAFSSRGHFCSLTWAHEKTKTRLFLWYSHCS